MSESITREHIGVEECPVDGIPSPSQLVEQTTEPLLTAENIQ